MVARMRRGVQRMYVHTFEHCHGLLLWGMRRQGNKICILYYFGRFETHTKL